FASVTAGPGESVEVEIPLPERAFEIWDQSSRSWQRIGGGYEVRASRSHGDTRLAAALDL
ncbi:fibronectin type III-like domain-contianing protein, partial [Streptomyces sp. NPDC059956]